MLAINMLKDAKTIIDGVKNINSPNEGVKALAKKALEDDYFCIMDKDNYQYQKSYRTECPDRSRCCRSDFMLACIQTIDANERKKGQC
jgi:hypothetical protein